MAIRTDDSGFLVGERRLVDINRGMNKVEGHTSEILAILKGLMALDNNQREQNSRQLNTISNAVVSIARAKPTVKVTINTEQAKVTRTTSSNIKVGANAGGPRTRDTSNTSAGERKGNSRQVNPIGSRVRNTEGVGTRENQPGRDSKGRFVARANNINDLNFADAVKRGVDLSRLGLNADVSHIDPTVDAVRELTSIVAPAQRALSFMGRSATWLFRKGNKRSEDIPRAQQDHYTDVDRHNSEERKLLRKLIDAVNRQGHSGLADLLGKLGLASLLPNGGRNGGNDRNRRNRGNGGRRGPVPVPVPDRDRNQRRNPPPPNGSGNPDDETRRNPDRNRRRGPLGRIAGRLGRFAGRIPLVGSLLGGAMLASEWGDMNNQERGGGIGAMVGGGIGGTIGSLAGPVGTIAGATVGSWIGDTIGQKVGKWTETLQQKDIGGTIVKTWNDTLDGINKMVKSTLSTAQVGLGMGGMGGGFMLASYRRGGGGSGGGGYESGSDNGASGGAPSTYNPNNEIPIKKVLKAGAGYNVVELADGSVVKQEGNWNWRNRNPGNIEDGRFAKSRGHVDLTDSEGNKETKRFAAFPTYAAGRKAKKELLFDSESYRDLDLMDAIKRYAPKKENKTGRYQKHVLAAVGANKRMGDYSAEEQQIILNAVQKEEGFVPGKVTVIKPATKTYDAKQPAAPQSAPNAAPGPKKLWASADGATPANQTKPLYVSNSPSVTPTNIPDAPNVLRRENSKPQPTLMASTANDVISQNPADRDIVHATTGGLGARPMLA
ncbi:MULTISPECIES: hypothetical protein [Acinetobacter]|uniref:hypothetical protein n=1 Tax=Acinetobacter TaxID=469 RepID=UPI001F05EE04|nr:MULTISPECIES: hypothetical protein [Acinetobacter]MCH2003650.1 hypothetical protein [Acinetobacter seifertii]WQF74931.1 hypothetical protein OKW95_19540 [Acinetobacter oleivorans]